ncbi:hypothetical protein IP92_03657 [Pseudoduganella flava]|uniref:DUF2029 domain-containing protein n=1 Tax=Pseudoduganella flava TaxID=871742 RepID=A0A562PM52_9BURK|nr:hypothetical protein [Pseudoduganella flava]QGZ41026.1 hypothetical protein GO485_19425 [Pseudoduganella flava]TWI45280.1 hypothetical protein IP92_03657 [Pseudoduganella flava]
MKLLAQLEAWWLRRTALLEHPRAAARAAILVPLLCGLMSLAMGQDDSYDMRNYHLYTAHALLNDRLGVDLAPAGFHSYFNPLLDVPYFLLTKSFPAPVAGFVFGALQGLAFVLVAAIARQLLGPGRLALLLGLAGIAGAGFLSELGNSMGDNFTALLVLASIYWLLRHWEQLSARGSRAVRVLLAAGALMGLGLGLKLTNVSYAVGACAALLTVAAPLWTRVRVSFVFGIGVLAGMAATAGYWMLRMWSTYGNPLFPQFNNIFHSPMAAEFGVIDLIHLPRNAGEALLWPFVFTRDMSRVAEVPIHQIIWPLLYVAVAAWGVMTLLRKARASRGGQGDPGGLAPGGVFLLVFTAVSYLVWMRVFSIYRYLVPIELLAPLLFWLLLHTLATPSVARRVGGGLLLAASLAVLPFTTWGHAGWAKHAFTADRPPIARPDRAVIFVSSATDAPISWLAQFMPAEAAVIGIGSSFPASPAFEARVQQVIAQRGGPHYVIYPVVTDKRANGLLEKTAIARSLGLTRSEAGCRKLAWLAGHVRGLKAKVDFLPASPSGELCTLVLQERYRKDTAPENHGIEAEAVQRLAAVGQAIDPATCVTYQATVGTEPYPYRFCAVTARH